MVKPKSKIKFHRDIHLCAWVIAGCALFLLWSGAFVTHARLGRLEPYWPLYFGGFFPPANEGYLSEFGHRMAAGVMSVLTLGLAIRAQMIETRAWVRRLAWAAVGMIALQGVLGQEPGLLYLPLLNVVAHAFIGQIFFCLTVILVLATSQGWLEETSHRVVDRPSSIRFWTTLTSAVVVLQVILGVFTRHNGAGLSIPDFPLSYGHLYPPDWSFSVMLQFTHTRIGAFCSLLFISHTAYRVCYHYPEENFLFWPAVTAAFFAWVQCFLGMLIIFFDKADIPMFAHVTLGVVILAAMLVLTINSYYLFKKAKP